MWLGISALLLVHHLPVLALLALGDGDLVPRTRPRVGHGRILPLRLVSLGQLRVLLQFFQFCLVQVVLVLAVVLLQRVLELVVEVGHLYARSPIRNDPVIHGTIFSRSEGRRKRLFENAQIMQNSLKWST